MYNWQQKDWCNFTYQLPENQKVFVDFYRRIGEVGGVVKSLSEKAQNQTVLDTMLAEAIKTSEIEGEFLSRKDVMSSIRNNLGLNPKKEKVADNRAEGVAQLMVDARNTFSKPLSKTMLFRWHKELMKGAVGLKVGAWRTHTEPMQVISGALGKEVVHFEAPPSAKVPNEMEQFIQWFNATAPNGNKAIKEPMVRAAIAHVYFETIHPFEDGNGRIGRALSEKVLSQDAERSILLSLSSVIVANKKKYYTELQRAQHSNELTSWIRYFIQTTQTAQKEAVQRIDFTLKKTKFFEQHKSNLNLRQLKVIKRMFNAGFLGFEGGMNAKKYIGVTKTSKATATRDLQQLLELGVFKVEGGGRSTRYELNLSK